MGAAEDEDKVASLRADRLPKDHTSDFVYHARAELKRFHVIGYGLVHGFMGTQYNLRVPPGQRPLRAGGLVPLW